MKQMLSNLLASVVTVLGFGSICVAVVSAALFPMQTVIGSCFVLGILLAAMGAWMLYRCETHRA